MDTGFTFFHERLDVYRAALEVHLGVRGMTFPRGQSWLRDQLLRASGSVVLNIAEADGRQGAARQNHLRIALGSAAEVCAGLDLLGDAEALGGTCRRVGAMLCKLVR